MEQSLPGVDGVVDLRNDVLRGHLLTVDGAVPPRRKGAYQLPGVDGTPVPAKLRGRFMAENPEVLLGDTLFRTGQATAPLLQIMAFLPLLLVLGSSILPIALAVVCVLVNLYVLRGDQTDAKKMVWMAGTFVVAVLVNSFWAVFSAWLLTLRG